MFKLDECGLTLLEIVVTVAIIGVISSISISNYQMSVSKARQAEAKLALAGIYQAEQSFYSEYSAYIADFEAIGFAPTGYKRFYALGWDFCSGTGNITGYTPVSSGNCFYARANVPAGFNTTIFLDFPQAWFTDGFPGAADVDPQVFTVWAGGQTRSGQVNNGNWWEIDNRKNLRLWSGSEN